MVIRPENSEDIQAIAEITRAAFATCPYSRGTEEFIINALRKAGDLMVSLVAEINGKVVGHIAFSPVTIADGNCRWYGMGPLSVVPALQKQGIGKALVNAGLQALKDIEAGGCVLVGDPAYYQRFGFRNIGQLTLEGVPVENFMALPFGEDIPAGNVHFHQAFAAES